MRFLLLVLFIKQLHLGPCSLGKNLFEYGFEFAEIFNFEIANVVTEPADCWWAVSMTPLTSGGRCQ
jgi:hypothetical protein